MEIPRIKSKKENIANHNFLMQVNELTQFIYAITILSAVMTMTQGAGRASYSTTQ